jgi:hypothetical protein
MNKLFVLQLFINSSIVHLMKTVSLYFQIVQFVSKHNLIVIAQIVRLHVGKPHQIISTAHRQIQTLFDYHLPTSHVVESRLREFMKNCQTSWIHF